MFEKLFAVENVVSEFARNQFAQSGLSIEESMLIVKSIYLKLSEQYINQSIMNRVKFVKPGDEKTEELKPIRTETVPLEEIMEIKKKDD